LVLLLLWLLLLSTQPTQPDTVLYTPVQVAAMLNIARTKVFALMKTGELKSVRIGRSRRILPKQVRDYVNSLLESSAEPEAPSPLLSRSAKATASRSSTAASTSRRATTKSRRR
jgi:excisionase family DNA binding protein